jgi:uncharacterized protein
MDEESDRPLAVVTGASSGIGYELAVQFAQHGFDLFICAEDDGITQASEDLKALGTQVESLQCDLAGKEGVEEFYRNIRFTERPVAALAINAGVGVGGKFYETDFKEELNLINLNIVSAVHLTKLVLKDMIKRREGGRLLFTSSVAATAPGPYTAVYAASKAFIQSFAEALRYELKDEDIIVTAFLPGATDTNFFHRAGMDDTKIGAKRKDDPAEVARQGFEAMMAGKDQIIAGSLMTKLGNAANDLIPESVKVRQHGKLTKPGSANG